MVGDCREVMAGLDDCSVDAIVTDPPYELGFMGKSWDASGIAYDLEVWLQALRVLKPGGHLLAFSGSRTYHRMVCAIEDAGFEIRDQIMWLYGSGFPKSHDVSKAIDREAGAERRVLAVEYISSRSMLSRSSQAINGYRPPGEKYSGERKSNRDGFSLSEKTAPATPEAEQWSGWGTALKPAHEPIVVARKPFKGTVAQNVLAHGTGALNIDGCRVGAGRDYLDLDVTQGVSTARTSWDTRSESRTFVPASGRWPANVIHDGSDEVLRLFPETGPAKAAQRGSVKIFEQCDGQWIGDSTVRGHDDAGGSAARFFYCAKASKRDREEGLDGSGSRANHHPTVKPTDLMRYLCRLVTPQGGLVLDPFTGSGSTGKAAVLEGFRFLGCELSEEYAAIARARIAAASTEAP
jgi:site-specific DNA-methyltransferase (adenine-specific)